MAPARMLVGIRHPVGGPASGQPGGHPASTTQLVATLGQSLGGIGDHLVVLHADKIAVTGNKLEDKMYHHHTGYLGNLKSIALGKLLQEHPERALEFAVKGMLPKTTLGRRMFRKLHVFAGDKHPHSAQQPKPLNI